ncbi:succinylglutamate desuccinylase/aspartoacylase domain-containing protein [Balneola vulgaris]|uniref:succinylglutamate desuccinylase/aspartoacylase domain-containing protein n=1 Tax=Balneola vulgaris TaxID=287535 RepID=UPI0003736407|nr:succinylglutamate desuccinylase/aspartoacylase family protein [Balneola vulgaris]
MATQVQRIIGRIDGQLKGPVIVALAGIHGNEPTGVSAIEHVLEVLKGKVENFRGAFIGLRGNIPALEKGVRYIDEDMNRIWFTSILDKVRRTPISELKTEERRQTKEVLAILDPLIEEQKQKQSPLIFADLHTFSSANGLFVISSNAPQSVNLLDKLQVPLIFGIEKALHGTALKYVQNTGNIGFAFEAGTHFSESAEYNATAGLYSLMIASGCLMKEDIPDYDHYVGFLTDQTNVLPAKVEFIYKHIIEDDDEFKMIPGFQNFDPVKKGDLLAIDRHGEIKAQHDGYLLMPLYQQQGNDGFFIVKDIE